MKISINRKDFLKAVKVGGCYTSGKKVLPILECIKLTVKGDKCWVLSSDERNAIKTYCSLLHSDCDMAFCINKNDIDKYISLLDDDTFSMDVDMDKKIVSIMTDTGSMLFPIESDKYFPTLSSGKCEQDFFFDAQLLAYWIRKGTPFLMNDEFQKNHENLHLFIKDRKVDVFCFGNTKMYHDSSDIDTDEELKLGINMNSFPGLLQALDKEEKVHIQNGERYIVVSGEKTMLLIRKDDYEILDYNRLLLFKPMFEVEVDKAKLSSIIARSFNIFDKPNIGTITFDYGEKGISITSENFDGNKSLSEYIEYVSGVGFLKQTYGTPAKIALDSINSDTVKLCPTGERSLLIIKNTEYETENSFTTPYQSF